MPGRWWLTPGIIATQEAEIRRIMVQNQPWANSFRDPISNRSITKKGWWSSSRCGSWVQTPVLQKKEKRIAWNDGQSVHMHFILFHVFFVCFWLYGVCTQGLMFARQSIWASWVARIIGTSHGTWLFHVFFACAFWSIWNVLMWVCIDTLLGKCLRNILFWWMFQMSEFIPVPKCKMYINQ
jgi:hypothetical protein